MHGYPKIGSGVPHAEGSGTRSHKQAAFLGRCPITSTFLGTDARLRLHFWAQMPDYVYIFGHER